MYYPDEIVEEVRSGNNIVDVIGAYVHLQKKGSSYFGLCPFHNEKSPSFSVSPAKQMYYCFGCGEGGNVFTFLMKYENQTFQEAVQTLAERAGIHLPEAEFTAEDRARQNKREQLLQINKTAAAFYYYMLGTAEGEQARQYFEKRALTRETIRHFGLGYACKYSNALYNYMIKKGWKDDILKESGLFIYDEKQGVHDKFWNRVMFPITDVNRKVIGFGGRVMGDAKPKYLNSPETMIFDKSRNLYGLAYARSSRKPYFIICEGYMDVIAMHQAGFTNAVASLGTAFTSQHAMLIGRYVNEVRLAYDSDTAGKNAARRAIGILRSVNVACRIIHMDPYKDPDEFIKARGSEAFQERIDGAESSFMFEISLLEEGYQMSDPADRAAFIRKMAEKLLIFPHEVERNVYIEALCSKYGIETGALKKMVNSLGANMTPEQLADDHDDDARERRAVRKKNQDEGLLTAQKLLLTWMIEDTRLFKKLEGLISEEDFDDPLYHRAAVLVFEEFRESGRVTPARILSRFDDMDEQSSVASLFNTHIDSDDDPHVMEKALNETVIKVKRHTYELAGARIADAAALQKLIADRAALQRLHITLD